MKVVLKTKISGKYGLHAAGETVDVPDTVGQKLIDRQHATAFTSTPPPAAPPAVS